MKKSEFWVIVLLVIIAIILLIASIFIISTKTGSLTGKVTSGYVNASLGKIPEFILTPDTVNFGVIALGASNNTISGGPDPFIIENIGNAYLNITITSTEPLFKKTSPVYQFNSSCYEPLCANEVYSTWTSFDQLDQNIVKFLDFNQANDTLRIDIKITAPVDETPGAKSDTLTFTATQAD